MALQDLGGQASNLRVLGQGARPVLALHCSLAHGGAWGPLAAELGDAVTLTAPDLPGHGLSADWTEPPGLHDCATAVARALAQQLAGGAPVDVMGHSFGGTLALRLALETPELVRSLTLFEPVMFAAAHQAGAPEARDWLMQESAFHDMLTAGDREGAAQRFHAVWGNGIALDRLPAAQRTYITDRIHVITAAEDVVVRDRLGLLDPGRLEALEVPVLLAEGGASPPVIGAINDALAPRLRGVRRISIPGAGHMLPLSHAAALAPAVRAHLGLPARERSVQIP